MINRWSLIRSHRLAYLIALTLCLVVFLTWGMNHLEGYKWDFDEGLNLMKAWLLHQGYSLYTDIWSDQPPLFTMILALAFDYMGASVRTARQVSLAFSIGGLLGIALLTKELAGRSGALTATIALMLIRDFLILSRAVMIGLPAISAALLALAFGLRYMRRGKKHRLLLAGTSFSCSLLIKPIMILLLAPLVLTVLLRHRKKAWPYVCIKAIERLGVLILGLSLIPLMLAATSNCVRESLGQVLGTFLESREVYSLNIAANAEKICEYAVNRAYHRGLLALGSYGALVVIVRRRSATAFVLASWFGVTLVTLLIPTPLRWHHKVLLFFPVATLAGVAVDQLLKAMYCFVKGSRVQLGLLLPLGIAVLGWYIYTLPIALREVQGVLKAPGDHAAEEVVSLIRAATSPEDFIVTDELMMAFRAQRRVPPRLAVPSSKRIRTGSLEIADLIPLTQEYAPQFIILWERNLARIPLFKEWMESQYRLVQDHGGHRQVYQAIDPLSRLQSPRRIDLGGEIEYLGHSIEQTVVEAGETVKLTLYWRATRKVETSYTVFTHLLDQESGIWGQRDSIPVWRQFATTEWMIGKVVPDVYEIPVDSRAPPQTYNMEVGMYDLATGERLPTFDSHCNRLPNDRILLESSIEVR